jgi:hypothetical protein
VKRHWALLPAVPAKPSHAQCCIGGYDITAPIAAPAGCISNCRASLHARLVPHSPANGIADSCTTLLVPSPLIPQSSGQHACLGPARPPSGPAPPYYWASSLLALTARHGTNTAAHSNHSLSARLLPCCVWIASTSACNPLYSASIAPVSAVHVFYGYAYGAASGPPPAARLAALSAVPDQQRRHQEQAVPCHKGRQ